MSLSNYNKKRNFKLSKEPEGRLKKSGRQLVFVVQKHAASHLHYDFRLEMEGVLKSWAVPKGPSMNPEDKRLAMMVEDHPYNYKDFEGTIPEGNYGAGNVIVWDNGTYESTDNLNKKEAEKQFIAGLQNGHLSFILHGKKLNGEFSLIKLKGKQANAWLLIKKEDHYSTEADVLKKNKSVLSKVSLEQLEKKSREVQPVEKKKKPPKQNAINKTARVDFIAPMLANTIKMPFDDKSWVYEVKYDGYRTIAVVNPGEVKLFSRNHLSFDHKFKAIADGLKKINHSAVLDGEVVIEDENGRSDFQLLQNYQKTGIGNLKYYVFDILYLDGNNTCELILLERKELLKILLGNYKLSNIFYSEHIIAKGKSFYKLAIKNKLEGIMAKNAISPYRPGKRSNEWLKIKIVQQEEAIIVGITEPKGARYHFGSLLLGQYDGEKLKYIGRCGTGFNEELLKELYLKFRPLFVKTSPFNEEVNENGKVQWLRPKFVCQVKFTEWTQDGHMRHPVFLGLRLDKTAKDMHMDMLIINSMKPKEKRSAKTPQFETEHSNSGKDFDLKVGKTILHLTNQNKIYFPDDGIAKGDIVNYYNEISTVMLPYLKGRPQSMNRFPNGINGQSFYQKDVDVDKVPSWLTTKKIYSDSNKATIDYLLCNDKATLLYMANLGCIEINPWNSTINQIENPDWVVIDLDPEKIDFREVVKTALAVKELMDELETACYCKTSGATGLHIYIPLAAKYDYDTAKTFAELIAHTVNERLPQTTSILRMPQKRQHKVYIDFLQNRKGQTLAAPYSVRPKPGAPVSAPLEWNEVNDKLLPKQFNMKSILKRLDKKGDLWKPVLQKGVDLDKVLKNISLK